MEQTLLLYVPVLHEGYLRLFRKYSPAVSTLVLVGQDLIDEFTFLEKEIRAIPPIEMRDILTKAGYFKDVWVADKDSIKQLNGSAIITANEVLSRKLVEAYLPSSDVTFDTIFLRWDEESVMSIKNVEAHAESKDSFAQSMVMRAAQEGDKSNCWWRQVGAIAARGQEIILESHNRHVPGGQPNYAEGDPRDFVKAGTQSEIATALHAEQALVSEAARQGISLEGCDVYLSVFPCPVCAKLLAYAGIRRCYYSTGHASLDGERILNEKGVKIIHVELEK